MRKVFSNSMVAHVWAQQSQPEGRSANGQFYFDGPTIYSYGSHFPVARFTDARLGDQQVVLVTSRGYSVTTARHKREVWHALRGLSVATVYCEYPTAYGSTPHDKNIAAMVADFNAHAAECAKPRKRMYFGWDDAGSCRIEDTPEQRLAQITTPDNLARYCRAFDLPVPDLGLEAKRQAVRDAFAKHLDPKAVAKRERDASKRMLKYAAAMSQYHAWVEGVLAKPPTLDSLPKQTRRDAERRIREANRQERVGITPEAWQAGHGDMGSLTQSWGQPTLVRRVVSGGRDRLETSRAAEVPFAHAIAVYTRAQACRSMGREWHRNGEQIAVGHFQLDSIDAQGNIKAGCHTIAWDEMLRLALLEVPHLVRAPFPVPALVAA
jgi:hypothetical protein